MALRRTQGRVQEYAWLKLASSFGLTCDGPRMFGMYRGRSLEITIVQENEDLRGLSGKYPTMLILTGGIVEALIGGPRRGTFHTMRVVLSVDNPVRRFMSIQKGGVLPFGRGVRTGDRRFDRRFRIRSRPQEFAASVLALPELRQRLLDVKGSIRMYKNELYYEQPWIEADAQRLRFLINLLYDLAEAAEQVPG
jgi:hypothetical protein